MAGLSSPSLTSRRHPPPPPKHERRPSANSAATASTNGQTTRHGSSVRSRASSRSRQPHSEDAHHGSSNTSNSIATAAAGNLKDSGSKCSQSDRSLNRNRSRPRHRPSVESASAGGSHVGGGRDRSSSIGPRSRGRAGGGGNAAVGSGPISSSSRVRGGREKEKDDNSSKKHQFATPFDNKGRCHYHSHMQLAKKKLTGGWKVLLDRCPQCIDEENNDNKSVRSAKSNRSTRSRRSAKSATDRGVRRSNTTGSGGGSVELRHRHQHQHYHHHSHNHYLHKVPSSPSSTSGNLPPPPPPPKQLQSQSSSSNTKKLPTVKKYTPKFQCPFDDQGYCHQHSHIRLAKKKLTGGWRILQEYCLECQREEAEEQSAMNDCRSVGSRGSRRSRRSRVSVGVSTNGGRSEVGETSTEMSTSQSEVIRKKIVKKMKYVDENGEEGLYTGYVNGQYKPHGRGKMVYTNGLRYDGTWSEGTKVHGKTTRGKSKSSSSSGGGKSKSVRRSPEIGGAGQEKENDGGSGTDAGGVATSTNARPTLKEYRDLYKSAGTVPDDVEKQTVKNMKFIDFYGDPGRYTGEVNDQKMPHGMGQMTYDHGLVQEGNWTNGILDEGSIISMPKNEARSKTSSSRVRDP